MRFLTSHAVFFALAFLLGSVAAGAATPGEPVSDPALEHPPAVEKQPQNLKMNGDDMRAEPGPSGPVPQEPVEAGPMPPAEPAAAEPMRPPEPGPTSVTFQLRPPVEIMVLEVPEPLHRPPPSGVAGFLRDRALDCADLFRARFHAPRGYRSVGFKARGTFLAQIGVIFFDGLSAGIDRRGAGIWRERRWEGGLGPAYVSRVHNEIAAGNRFTDVRRPWSRLHWRGIVRNGLYWDDGRWHPLSCGAELHLFVFGLELETYPLEWLDVPLGWCGLDSANDDESRVRRQWTRLQSVPELAVRDEWKEPRVEPSDELAVPSPDTDRRKGVLVTPGETPPAPGEAPLEEPESRESRSQPQPPQEPPQFPTPPPPPEEPPDSPSAPPPPPEEPPDSPSAPPPPPPEEPPVENY